MIRRVSRGMALGLAALVLCSLLWSLWTNRTPHDRARIAMLTDRLFEYGAIEFVHAGYIGPEMALFACVHDGKTLSVDQSARYRVAYTAYLQSRQSLFRLLDNDLTLRTDFRMDMSNNTGGHGIAGTHDQHDLSAISNLSEIADNLAALPTANPFRKTVLTNEIYKNLTDLMVHLAPAVHANAILQPEAISASIPPVLAKAFSEFYLHVKRAQSARVNSAAYWLAIDRALLAYGDLVEHVQKQTRLAAGALTHGISGQWLSLQTIAPMIDASSPAATSRKNRALETQPICNSD